MTEERDLRPIMAQVMEAINQAIEKGKPNHVAAIFALDHDKKRISVRVWNLRDSEPVDQETLH